MSVSRIAKLRAMPPQEIAHRISYAARTALERRAHTRGRLAIQDRVRPGTSAHHGAKFFAWQDDPDRFRTMFESRYAAQLQHSRQVAEQVRQGEISFFGRTFCIDRGVNWHADPVSGVEWPRLYHRDVPVDGGNVGFGDIKYVWELNRHQFFVDLAKVAFLDRDARHAETVHALLRSWRRDVPYATGAPWACALEPAFRAWSWMWAYELLRSAGFLTDEDHEEWLAGFYDHGRFLNRHLEFYSSPYNHLIGEAAALFALGLLFPEFDEAAQWMQRGRKVLETELAAQFFADGGTVEQSTFYHHATLGFYMLAMVIGERNRTPLSEDVRQAVERALNFSMALMQPDGRIPSIGGADDGKPIRLEHLPFWDFRAYLAAGSVMFTRPDFKAAAGRFFEDAFWLLGLEGAERFDRLTSRAPDSSRALRASGYYVARSGSTRDADYLCFDCGAQAGGLREDDVPSAAHGHADCLSVIVTLGGHPVLVDPGFFCYNGDPEWEVFFRKTAAHNTLTVDGRDQARHISKMAWVRTYRPSIEGWAADGNLAWARGSHNGFARMEDGVVHRRTVWLRPDGYVVLYDEIIGSGSHTVQANFQFAPGTLALNGAKALYDGRFEMVWVSTAPSSAHVRIGEDGPDGGWIARSLGVREAAPRVTIDFKSDGPRAALLTVLADRARVAPERSRTEAFVIRPGVLAARIHLGGAVDEVFASADTGVLPRGVETDAPLAAVRVRDGRVIDAAQAGGTRVWVSGRYDPRTATEQPCAGMAINN